MKFKALFTGVGAGLMYFLDPQQGARRRNMTRDRTLAFFRTAGRRSARAGRGVAAEAYGVTQKITHMRDEPKELDDITLARKVESEIFRDRDVPKGNINVNVIDGVVELRGEIEEPGMIEDLEQAARKVGGVKDVENLLHTPGTPAPTTPEGGGES